MDGHIRCDTLHVCAPARRNSPVRTHTASARVTGCALARNQASAGMFATCVCEVGGQAPLRVFMGAFVGGGVHAPTPVWWFPDGIGRAGRRSTRAPALRAHCGALSALWCIPCERHFQVACPACLWLPALSYYHTHVCVCVCLHAYIRACVWGFRQAIRDWPPMRQGPGRCAQRVSLV